MVSWNDVAQETSQWNLQAQMDHTTKDLDWTLQLSIIVTHKIKYKVQGYIQNFK
ncbi:hypothetical protein GJ744_003500 [Endocarpon pusillum]|uniref:Uncharacterized protein n=1 Tax=Endocarpon pusillum TaxID=364733 RepID=A0A8H7AP61_9EURO|nr:hypothetical protein GJ744_003500 [Endocarpon pusillum]